MVHRRFITAVVLLILLLASFIQPLPAAAQTDPPPNPILLKNINPALSDQSNPHNLMVDGPLTYIFTHDGDEESALWKTDGTPSGTMLLKSGLMGPPSYNFSYAAYKDYLYFPAYTPESGEELWRTDGTAEGTELFADINPGEASSQPRCLTVFEDRLYFSAGEQPYLQSTDGTPEGTTNYGAGTERLNSPFVVFDGSLYYSASISDPDGGNSQSYLAWFGSGGSGRTTGLTPGRPLAVYQDRLYFTASRADVGSELWSTGGTADSVSLLRDITPGGDSYIRKLVFYDGRMYFTVIDAAYNHYMWVSDGTEAGTLPVLGLPEGFNRFSMMDAIQPQGAGKPGGLMLETVEEGGDVKLWFSDGTGAGTQLLAELYNSDKDIIFDEPLTGTFNNLYYFSARDDEHGMEIWQTDGSLTGTTRMIDLRPGPRGSYPTFFSPCGDWLCFVADDGEHGREEWRTDGTPAGTTLMADLNTHPADSFPDTFTPAGSLMYFTARDGVEYENLWRTDGTPDGTYALNLDPAVTIQVGAADYDPRLATQGTTLFFPASDALHGEELWKTDGTLSGTSLLKDILPGPDSSTPRLMVMAKDRLFFRASTSEPGHQLWVSDGTENGTRMVKDINPNKDDLYIDRMIPFGERVIFSTLYNTLGSCDLWVSDGSPAGTVKISNDHCLRHGGVVFEGKLYFSATQSSNYHPTLWETDGTAGGIQQVPTGNEDESVNEITHITPTSHGLYFNVQTNRGYLLMRVPAGGGQSSELVIDITHPDGMRNSIYGVTGFGNQVAFIEEMPTAETEGTEDQIWVSDGSQAGTWQIQAGFTSPSKLLSTGGKLFFFASDPEHGSQIWQTDGTSAGTQRISAYTQTRCAISMVQPPLVRLRGKFLLPLEDAPGAPQGSGCELWAYDYDYDDPPPVKMWIKTWMPIVRK